MKPTAMVRGIPRVKGSQNSNPGGDLQKEIGNVKKTRRYYPPVGVVGYPGSGKKTLAHRFGNLSTGPFIEEVPVKNIYGNNVLVKLEENREACLLLKFYIIDPSTLSPHTPPLYLKDWSEFCCMVLVFDINEKKTFDAVPQYLRILREEYFDIEDKFFIVGNKSDLRRVDETRRTQVGKRKAKNLANLLGGTYYECSAKENKNVLVLLNAIRHCGNEERYITG